MQLKNLLKNIFWNFFFFYFAKFIKIPQNLRKIQHSVQGHQA